MSDLENRFIYHPPTPDKVKKHNRVRTYLLQMAEEFDTSLPPCREKSLAITHLEQVMFWANAAIARYDE
jgi:hypothetical protein